MNDGLRHVTVAMLRESLTLAEQKQLPAFSSEEGGESYAEAWLQERVRQACDRVVAAINTCSRNTAIKSGLCRVPAACVKTALVLARQDVLAAVPGMAETLEGGTRSAEYSTAVQELNALASCHLVPDYKLTEEELATGGECGLTVRFGEKASTWVF